MQIKPRGLRALHERGDGSRLSADLIPRMRRILLRLEGATRPGHMDVPGYHQHPLKGDRRGLWSVRVSGNWRVVFRFEGTEAVDVSLIDYHRGGYPTMATMYDPPHLGELIRESMEAEGWTVTATAERLGVSRVALSRVLNGRASVSAALALALERIGWSDAEHWMRMQAIYAVAQERRKQAEVQRAPA